MSIIDLIAELRGGKPERCDRCDQVRDVIPISGDAWLCEPCLKWYCESDADEWKGDVDAEG